ncbi:MAG: S1 family peptidase [Polyangiaceae bacterium]|jgi:V8-like Glu-specific endopeptidase
MISSKVVRTLPLTALAFVLTSASGACASKAPAPTVSTASQVQVDQTEIVSGVDDNGRDPAVVALDVGADSLCSGTLIAPDVLLTARHCVSITADTIACPATGPQVTGERPPSSLRVLSGDKVQTAREVARGTAVVLPPGDILCDADIALVLLDQAVDVDPLDVSTTGVTAGDHVTSVGYGRKADGDPPGTKLFREHVEVLSTTAWEFLVGEATCQGDSGGPALDETTGDIVGIVSRGGPTCDGPGAHNVYTRTDAFQSLINEALSMSVYQTESATDDGGVTDAGKKKKKKPDGGTSKPPSDMGNPCTSAADCGTGVCVTDQGTQYCSRDCGTGDRCPDHYHCTATSSTQKVCLQVQ